MTQSPTAPAPSSQRYPRRVRLRKRHEYLALQRNGARKRTTHFTVITRQTDNDTSRLGVTTSRKVGNAPQRNRIRRLVREFFRRHREAIQPPRDIVIIARPGAAAASGRTVTAELARALAL